MTNREYDLKWLIYLRNAEERAAQKEDYRLAAYLRDMRRQVTRRMREVEHERALGQN